MLHDKAMLADVTIGYWSGSVADKRISEGVRQKAGAERDAGNWYTRLVSPTKIQRIYAFLKSGRATHFNYTLPWMNDGARILPATLFMAYRKAMQAAEKGFRDAVEGFLQEYPTILTQAKDRLGNLFDSSRYPSVEELRSKFHWSIRIFPLPTATDFRVNLGEEETARIRKDIEEQMQNVSQVGVQDMAKRLFSRVKTIAERLKDPDAILRDSMLKNTVELCDVLEKLNVMGDKTLTEQIKAVREKLTQTDVGTLRVDKAVREKTANSASSILEKMKGLMG